VARRALQGFMPFSATDAAKQARYQAYLSWSAKPTDGPRPVPLPQALVCVGVEPY
jgi:hypothetical protein